MEAFPRVFRDASWLVALAWITSMIAAAGCTHDRAAQAAGAAGAQIFAGARPAAARMAGHTDPLPAEAVRCTNCHQREAEPAAARVADAAVDSRDFGPRLGPRSLVQAIPRRGGPPSVYDAASFCRVLRDGVDPAHVVIAETMPRYTLTDGDCQSLWTFLTST